MRILTGGMLANINKAIQATGTGAAPFIRLVLHKGIGNTAEIQNYVDSGDIAYSVDNTIISLNLKLVNDDSLFADLFPNRKLDLYLGLGSEEMFFRSFYLDRVYRDTPGEAIDLLARNSIGKKLLDQDFGGNVSFIAPSLKQNLEAILSMAGIDEYIVADGGPAWSVSFTPETSFLDGINKVISILPGWRLDENSEGKIVIAPASNINFDQVGTYAFHRDKNCWSYDTEKDDSETYGRIIVTCQNPSMSYAFNVSNAPEWSVSPWKTLHIDVPDWTTSGEITAYGNLLAAAYANAGTKTSYTGKFSPQLIIGDSIDLYTDDVTHSVIGSVTEVTHYFGKDGFYTSFVVDSAGRKGRTKFSDFFGSREAFASLGEGGEEPLPPIAPDNYLSAENIIAGENITVERSGRNVTVSSSGGGGSPSDIKRIKKVDLRSNGMIVTLEDSAIITYTYTMSDGKITKLTDNNGVYTEILWNNDL